jgi:peptide/nickel transport system ATP-binding protein/oligopeptide transport system ATP-binding protein
LAISTLNERQTPLIDIKKLTKYYRARTSLFQRAAWVQALDDVSLQIFRGETLGVVGESGCGKTTLARSILRLVEPTSGQVFLEGSDVLKARGAELKKLRRNMQIIFQDPQGALSPRMPVGEQVVEGLRIHGIGTSEERQHLMMELLRKVGLESYHAHRYPHEFSGGQLQRIGIARALALRPKFIICDEPVSALDVSIQSQVLNLLNDLQQEFGLTFMFIAHNLNVVEHISRRVAVMYLGKIVELADVEEIYSRALHPYTQAILSSIPRADPDLKNRKKLILTGDVPSPLNPPKGCRFHPRCPLAINTCKTQEPPLKEYWVVPVPGRDNAGGAQHLAACWRAGDSATS